MATVIIDAPFVYLRENRAQLSVLFGPQNRPCFGHAFYGRWIVSTMRRHRDAGQRCVHYRLMDEPCPACFTLYYAHLAEHSVVPPTIISCGTVNGWPSMPRAADGVR